MSNPYSGGGGGGADQNLLGGGGAQLFEALGMSASQDKQGVWTVNIPRVVKGLDAAWQCGQTKYGNWDLVGRGLQPHDDGEHFIVTCTYQGADVTGDGDGGGASYADRTTVYDMSATWEEEPIESHPKIQELLKKYSGRVVNGEVIWDKELPADTDGGMGGGGDDSPPDKNPMYGVVRWKRLGVTWSATRILNSIPSGILSSVGKKESSVPGGPPNVPTGSTWMKLPPKANKRGNVWSVTEEWMLIDSELPEELVEAAGDTSNVRS